MKIVFGLGNPGLRYSVTRHNCGFLTLDQLAHTLDAGGEKNDCDCLVSSAMYKGQKILLAKPQSFMNLSGFPLVRLCSYYKVEYSDILVIHDDMDMPPGVLRLRRGGSDGGHNGIKSIISQTGVTTINRLKIGIGHPVYDSIDHVLSPFAPEEIPLMAAAFARGAEAALCWAEFGIGEAMNRFNHNPEPEQEPEPME